MKISSFPKSKMKRSEANEEDGGDEITMDWRHFDMFAKGKEIIASREKFLKVLRNGELEGYTIVGGCEERERDGCSCGGHREILQVILPVGSARVMVRFFLFSFPFRIFCFLIFSPKTGKVTVSFSSYTWIRRTRSDDCIRKTAVFIGNVVEVCVAVMGLEI